MLSAVSQAWKLLGSYPSCTMDSLCDSVRGTVCQLSEAQRGNTVWKIRQTKKKYTSLKSKCYIWDNL